MTILDIVKVFLPAVGAFVLGVLVTPVLTNFLYSHRMWKKKSGKIALDGHEAKVFNELHKEKEVNTPRMGGIIIWFSSVTIIVGIWIISKIFPGSIILKLDFLSRSQTWIPLATLILGALAGLIDDYMEIKDPKNERDKNGGLSLKKRLLIVSVIALACAWWFYVKLNVVGIGLPFGWWGGELYLGPLFIILFLVTTLFIYANAGLPNPMSDTGFDETPDLTSGLVDGFAGAFAFAAGLAAGFLVLV